MARLGSFVRKGDNVRKAEDPQKGRLVIFLTYKPDQRIAEGMGFDPKDLPALR